MRFNGVLLYELGLWGHAGVEEGELWLFTDVLYPIIFMLSGGRNGKHELNGAFHMWSNPLLTSGWDWVGLLLSYTQGQREDCTSFSLEEYVYVFQRFSDKCSHTYKSRVSFSLFFSTFCLMPTDIFLNHWFLSEWFKMALLEQASSISSM